MDKGTRVGGVRVLIVGSGAREHALAWGLARSTSVARVYCAPGNPGIAAVASLVPVASDDLDLLVDVAVEKRIDLVVVGPEAPLVAGLVDRMSTRGILCVGPTAGAAALEGSKVFAKRMMSRAGIPTASYKEFTSADEAEGYVSGAPIPLVIKADGLAAGKGVTVCATRGEALAAVDAAMRRGEFGEAGARIVVEECLVGEEVSLLALTDGEEIALLVPAQDHKRLLDGDQGPNTGGMGAIAPSPALSPSEMDAVRRTIIAPILRVMRENGTPFRGVLYAGLMRTERGLQVLEFNCRFGDPEAQAVIPLLKSDLYEALRACAVGGVGELTLEWHPQTCLAVTLADAGYPAATQRGAVIAVDAERDDVLLFYGATTRGDDGQGAPLVTAGGRVMTVVARGDSLEEARARLFPPPVHFAGMHYRTDIGARASHC